MTYDEKLSLEHFGDLLIDAYLTSGAEKLSPGRPIDEPIRTEARHGEAAQTIINQMSAEPETLDLAEAYQKNRISAAMGTLLCMPRTPESTYDPEQLRSTLYWIIGRSAVALEQIANLRDVSLLSISAELPRPASQVPAGSEVTFTPTHEPSSGADDDLAFELRPSGPNIQIDANGSITVNGNPLELLPTQRVVFDHILDSDGPFRLSEIYNSAEFQDAVMAANQSSRLTSAFANTYRGVGVKLWHAGVRMEDIVSVVGGGPRSRVIQRNPAVKVDDKRIIAEVEDLAYFIFDQMDYDQPINIKDAALNYFEIPKLSVRHRPAIEMAIEYLVAHLEDPELSIEREDGSLALEKVQSDIEETTSYDEKPDRGMFIDVDSQRIIFENAKFEFNEIEQMIMAVLLEDVQHRKGITKRHLRNFLSERNVDTSSFESEFAELRHKLAPQIQRVRQNRKTRYNVIVKPPKRNNQIKAS